MGLLLGGAITSGPHFLAQALAEGTARLPHVMPIIEPWTVGKNTEQAIRGAGPHRKHSVIDWVGCPGDAGWWLVASGGV